MLHQKIPEFEAQALHQNKFIPIRREHLLGHWSVLFFYPADFTFVCPTELEDLADHEAEFDALGVKVMTVSTDTHFTHKAWKDHSEAVRKVNFPMLADPTHQLSRHFGVLDEATGLAHRATFVINPQGRVVLMELNDEGIGRHADELIRKIKAAQFVAEHPGQVCPAKWRKKGDATLTPGLDLVGKI